MNAIWMALIFPWMAQAGVLNGGGGKGVLCRSPKISVEALDIYESKNFYKLTEAPRLQDLRSELAFGMKTLDEIWSRPQDLLSDSEYQKDADDYLKEFFDAAVFIPPGTRLPLTNDATVPVLPVGCEAVQIAMTNNLGMQIDREYWDMLDARNQAALMMHEGLYRWRQYYGQALSDEVRRFVGRMFSTTPPVKRFENLPLTGYADCEAVNSATGILEYGFLAYPDGVADTRVSFSYLAGENLLGRTSVMLNSDAMRLLTQYSPGHSKIGEFTQMLTSDARLELRNIDVVLYTDGFSIRTVDRFSGKATPYIDGRCVQR